ncbi:MAG: GNAT family N-acetyltransferase, partial [Pseudonocardiaceae bacterium]
MAELLRTDRLLVREWSVGDAEEALSIYGHPDTQVTQELRHIPHVDAMREVLAEWTAEQDEMAPGTGRWAM